MISLEYMKGVFQLIGWDGVFLIFVLSIAIISIKDYLKRRNNLKVIKELSK